MLIFGVNNKLVVSGLSCLLYFELTLSKDRVHLFVSTPPNMAASEIMWRVKGRSSLKLFESFPDLKKRYWGRHF